MREPFRFPLPLLLRAHSPEEIAREGSDRALYTVEAEFLYQSAAFGVIAVPKGYVTDFASIPRPVWWYLSPEDPAVMFASLIHDRLYTVRGDLGRGDNLVLSRKSCDAILQEAMLACGARPRQAWVVYQAVQLGGAPHWK